MLGFAVVCAISVPPALKYVPATNPPRITSDRIDDHHLRLSTMLQWTATDGVQLSQHSLRLGQDLGVIHRESERDFNECGVEFIADLFAALGVSVGVIRMYRLRMSPTSLARTYSV